MVLEKMYDVIVVGGGPAGMSAALAAKKAGCEKILIVEREPRLGGILEQCIHNGFGLHKFKREMTGPEYAEVYEEMVNKEGISSLTNTMVLRIDEEATSSHTVTIMNTEFGFQILNTKAIVLSMGCREKSRGTLAIPGTRPAGVYSAGTAQKIVNIKGYLPGKKVVILGSGDIGLIMARRMTIEGAEVKAVLEIMKDSGGLTRNIVQCLNDYNIPLKLSTTVIDIEGKDRVTGVKIAKVDDNLNPIDGTEEHIECDTLLLSVGLVPENELTKNAGIEMDPKTRGPLLDYNRQTSKLGIFAAGNVVKVHELVDFVSDEGEIAGTAAGCYALGKELPSQGEVNEKMRKQVEQKKGVKNLAKPGEDAVICTICPNGCRVTVKKIDGGFTTEGNICKRGEKYAILEVTKPHRTLTTTMLSEGGNMVPVKTSEAVNKEIIPEIVKVINEKTIKLPVHMGDIIIENVLDSGVNVIAAKSFK